MILVFVGAGGSAAVDPEQYPTTLRFFEKLPEEIQKNELFVRVADFFRSNLGRVHTFERFNDECEADEEGEHHIQLVEPRKDAAESLQSAKEPLHFIAFLLLLSVVRPRFTAIALGRHDRSRS